MFKKYQIGLSFAFWHLFFFIHLLQCARPHPVGHPVDDVSLARRYRVLIASPQNCYSGPPSFRGPFFSKQLLFILFDSFIILRQLHCTFMTLSQFFEIGFQIYTVLAIFLIKRSILRQRNSLLGTLMRPAIAEAPKSV